jgi:microcin C transport system ATP-binding protein
MSLVAVEHLTLAAGSSIIVDQLSFAIDAHETLAIAGPTGAGKTLTARALLNLLPAGIRQTAGTIMLDGTNLATATKHQLQKLRGGAAGMIFQDPNASLNPLQRIGHQLAETIRAHTRRNPSNENLLSLLSEAGFIDPARILAAYPHTLSGGQRQRAMLAIAIANNPKLLIADEPTASLDSASQAAVFDRLAAIRRQRNLALLLITHDLPLIRHQADRILILANGRLAETGPTTQIFAKPSHQQTKTLLAAGTPPPPLPSMPGPIILQAENLTVTRPILSGPLRIKTGTNPIIQNVSFHLHAGETLGLIGPSGAGKTTIALTLLNLVKHHGSITLDGKNLASLTRRQSAAAIQIVFQNPYSSLSPRLPLADIITEGLTIHSPHLTPDDRAKKLQTALNEVGLPTHFKTRLPAELSGGEAQRAAIARALIIRPKILILDEPTSALDAQSQSEILHLLQSLQQSQNLAYLLITHNQAVTTAMAHRTVVLHEGRIVGSEGSK